MRACTWIGWSLLSACGSSTLDQDSGDTAAPIECGEEICNGLDDDCDGVVDEEPIDGTAYFADADGDGEPSTIPLPLTCETRDLPLTPGNDCDDDDPTVLPGAVDVCDGVDNDCNGIPDDGPGVLRVSETAPTLQQAIDTVEESGVVCVSAGTYGEPLQVGRDVTLQAATEEVVFDLGRLDTVPAIRVEGTPNDFPTLTLRGFRVTGQDLLLPEGGTGTFGYTFRGTLVLEDVTFESMSYRLPEGTTSLGLVLNAGQSGSLVLRDVHVDGLEIDFVPGNGESVQLEGSFIGIDTDVPGPLELDGVVIDGLSVRGPSTIDWCIVTGSAVSVFTGDSIRVRGHDLEIRAPDADLRCRRAGLSTIVRMARADFEDFVGLHIEAASTVVETEQGGGGTLLSLSGSGFYSTIHDVSVAGAVVDVTGSLSATSGALVAIGDDLAIAHLTVRDNVVTAHGSTEPSTGRGAVTVRFSTAQWVDIRNNTMVADRFENGVVQMVAGGDGPSRMENLVVAGNYIGAPGATIFGGLLRASTSANPFHLLQADLVGNTVEGATITGGLAFLNTDFSSGDGRLRNVQFVDNQVLASDELDGGLFRSQAWEPGRLLFEYANVFNNAFDASLSDAYVGLAPEDQVEFAAFDPRYINTSNPDPIQWDLTLPSDSLAIDAGHPDDQDPDGTRSDLGAYGGAGGDW